MTHWKNTRLTKSFFVFFGLIAAVSFFSCNKTSEEPVEMSSEQSQSRPPESAAADTASVNPPRNVPAEPTEQSAARSVPVPESVVPESIRRPRLGEAPRYPADVVIGALGAGEASPESYRFVRGILRGLLREASREEILLNLPPEETERIIGILQEVVPQEVRIGGGMNEEDGSTSFLLRFMGTDNWSGGEIFIRQHTNAWNLENLILDETREMSEQGSPYRFDFSPYERFF